MSEGRKGCEQTSRRFGSSRHFESLLASAGTGAFVTPGFSPRCDGNEMRCAGTLLGSG